MQRLAKQARNNRGSVVRNSIEHTVHYEALGQHLPGPATVPKIMDTILPLLSTLGYWAIMLGTFGGPGNAVTGRFARIFSAHEPTRPKSDRQKAPASHL